MSGPDWSLLDGEMDMPKPELESFPSDDIPWAPVDGAPPGHYQKILTEDPEGILLREC